MNVKILYEDNHVIAVEKPAGVLTQPDYTNAPSLLDMVKQHIKKRDNKPGNVFLGMVQRLDKPVSGVIFFAKTSKAAGRISEQIRQHQTEKIYLALTEKHGSGLVADQWKKYQAHLIRQKDRTEVVESPDRGKIGILEAKLLVENKNVACVLIKLLTGRKHQIRSQLSHLGYPIVGDMKYGSSLKEPKKKTIALHALYGALTHPTLKKRVCIVTPLPDYYELYFTHKEIGHIQGKLREFGFEGDYDR